MAETVSPSPSTPRRSFARWARRFWSTQADKVPLDERVRQIETEAAQFADRLTGVGRWSIVGLLVASAATACVAPFLHVETIVWLAVIFAALSAFPTALEAREAYRRVRHQPSDGRYRSWIEKQTERLASVIQRRRLNTLFARYGRDELATRIPDLDASWFSLGAQSRRRRNTRIVVAAIVALALVSLGIRATFFGRHDKHAELHEEFALGPYFKLTVNGPPTCEAPDNSSQHGTCRISITVRNATLNPQHLGTGSLGAIYSWGADYSVYGVPWLVDYASSLFGPGGYYPYVGGPYFNSSDLQPGKQADDMFEYDADPGTTFTEVLFRARANDRTTIHVRFGIQ